MAIQSGSDANDSLSGTPDDDQLYGLGGDDILQGLEGNDQLGGAAGNDELYGGDSDDVLAGEADQDHLEGGLGDDTLLGGAGNDELLGQEGTNVLRGGDGDDFFLSNGVQDILLGGAGNDLVDLNVCQDVVADTGPGDDEVWLWAPEGAVLTLGEGLDKLIVHHWPGADHSATVLDYQKGEDVVQMGVGWSDVALRRVDGDTILEARSDVTFTIRFVDTAEGIDLSF
jgi:Ca2+-binding RTX toxin-like protein